MRDIFRVDNNSQENYLEHQSKKEWSSSRPGIRHAGCSDGIKINGLLYYRTKLQVHYLAFYNMASYKWKKVLLENES